VKRMMAMLLGLGLASAAYAQTPGEKKPEAPKGGGLTDPVEILKKADEAAKAAKSVQYTASAKGLGTQAARTATVEGTVILLGWKNNAPEKWIVDAKAQRAGSSEANELVAGFDGNNYYLIDKPKKTMYQDMDQAVMGSGARLVQGLLMVEFVHPTPFTDEINADKQELRGTTKIGDEECYEVFVKYKGVNQQANWFFSTKDFLPRRVDRRTPGPGGAEGGGTTLTVTKLAVQPKFEKDPFVVTLPEGYTKSKEFAP